MKSEVSLVRLGNDDCGVCGIQNLPGEGSLIIPSPHIPHTARLIWLLFTPTPTTLLLFFFFF